MSDLSIAYETQTTPARVSGQSADELADELRREIAWLEFDSLALKDASGRFRLARGVSSVVSAAGSKAGQSLVGAARRDPLPFAAAISGVAWFAANAFFRQAADRRAVRDPLTSDENPPQRRNIVPALGLLLGAGAIVGARLGEGRQNL